MSSTESEIARLNTVKSDPRYLAFIGYFNNERDYYECHEVMEELWLEEGRSPLLQGLLQAAVGLHHWDNGNLSGAVKLMSAALAKLSRYEGAVLGLDLLRVRTDLQESLEMLTNRDGDGEVPFVPFLLRIYEDSLSCAVEDWVNTQKNRVQNSLVE